MISDPFILHSVVKANAEIATAMENLASDTPDYDATRGALAEIAELLEALIVRVVKA